MRFLVIDTCTEQGIVAYGSTNELLFEQKLSFGLNQSKYLLPGLMLALKPYGLKPELAAIGVCIGPGSYTGIRIGVAVAQALAYSWNVPLIGIPSLEGFIPSAVSVRYAAIVDARVGGLYFQKGRSLPHAIEYEGEPQICPLEDAGEQLAGITHLVTPNMKSLQPKLSKLYPNQQWVWEERAPEARMLLHRLECKHAKGEMVIPPQHLELLYLRKTEAERELRRVIKN